MLLCRAGCCACACASALRGCTQVCLIAAVRIETKSKTDRVPSLSPVLTAHFDQTKQNRPEMRIPVELSCVMRAASSALSAIKLVGQMGGVGRLELGEVGSMGWQGGYEPIEELDVLLCQTLERLIDRKARRGGGRSCGRCDC